MEVDEADAVHCEVSAGSVVFFAFGTPHATGPIPSNRDRTGIGVHFINRDYMTDELSERNPAGEPVYTTSDDGLSLDLEKSERWQALVREAEDA
jgi:ectoine hydroxylase-related dioxygenase (phytanoyl-CoA dioxygenase family)